MIPAGCVEQCRGCKHREWSEEESLQQKYNFLAARLAPWSSVLQPVVSVHGAARWGYRSKVTLSAAYLNSSWLLGMLSRDELIPIPNCPVHAPIINSVASILSAVMPPAEELPLAFIVQSASQVVMVVRARQVPDCSWLTPLVETELRSVGVEGLWLHCNFAAGKRMFEKTPLMLLFGQPRSQDEMELWYGPGAFQQLIPSLYHQSLAEAARFLAPDVNHSVVDLYCGTGASMRQWRRLGAPVLGVELGGEAVACAGLNVPDAVVLRGACRHRVPQVDRWAMEQREKGQRLLLYVNPPRTGLEPEVLSWIVDKGRPDRLAYLSCSAGTLAKNLSVLAEHGYRVEQLVPFDFFPQTIHVECLALLRRGD
ncbi:MAG TPA: hypothetical protein VMW01_04450 [Williamwhitmania sp.]|nr:hypothetical protein [Williamwhitmania sp.]